MGDESDSNLEQHLGSPPAAPKQQHGSPPHERMLLQANLPDDYEETYLETKVEIPNTGEYGFSFRKLWVFTGPGFLMSIAYLDPGNIESDLRSGSVAEYRLLWVLMWSTVLGYFMQCLSVKLGVVTGMNLAELCYREYHNFPRIVLWIMIEIAIIGSDMQEVIGTSIAFYLLSNKAIPLWGGVLITLTDTFTFLLLDKYGLRKLEALFGFLILVMAATFGYEYGVAAPNQIQVLKGMFIPYCPGCDNGVLLLAVGVVGAVIMPHNLYLHSALVKSRNIDRTKKETIKEANKYYFIEAAIALIVSFIINVFVVAVFASRLYNRTNIEVRNLCIDRNNTHYDVFPNNTEPVEADIYTGGVFLGCQFDIVCMYIWAVGILAAGQSSTMTGTYAGQFVMEGFLNLRWARWKRVLFTRIIAIFPTLFITVFKGIDDLTGMNDLLNSIMSLQLPFALIPVVTFTSSKFVMGDFHSNVATKILAICLSFLVIGINLYFVGFYASTSLPGHWAAYLGVAVGLCLYMCFVLYLIGVLLAILGVRRLEAIPAFRRRDYLRHCNTSSEPDILYGSINVNNTNNEMPADFYSNSRS